MSLAAISATLRLVVLISTILGFALACGGILSAHLDVVAVGANGEKLRLARARRAMAAISVAIQLAFLGAGWSFVENPPGVPTAAAQIGPFLEGLRRIAYFGLGSVLLATQSVIALRIR